MPVATLLLAGEFLWEPEDCPIFLLRLALVPVVEGPKCGLARPGPTWLHLRPLHLRGEMWDPDN